MVKNSKNSRDFVEGVEKFLNGVGAKIDAATNKSLQATAPILMQAVIDQAGFDDYTGVLANSYIVATVVKGKIAQNMSKGGGNTKSTDALFGTGSRGHYKNNWNSFDMRTKWHLKGMSTIKHARHALGWTYVGKKYFTGRHVTEAPFYRAENRLSRAGHKPWIKISVKDYKKNFNRNGWGKQISRLRGEDLGIKSGSGLILTNGAPYAEKVHNSGSRVFPVSIKVAEGAFTYLLKDELRKLK